MLGGGISGLATALELAERGHDVRVFEARARPGGRLHTVQIGESTVELGGTRFAKDHHRTLRWIRRMGLETVPMYPDRGRLVRLEADRRVLGPDARFIAPWRFHDLMIHPESWPEGRSRLRSSVRGALSNLLGEPDWLRVEGGNQQLPERMAARLGARIVYDAAVRRVVRRGADYELTLATDERSERWECDRVVLAVPLATLDTIEFEPALPAGRRDLIESIATQPAMKTFARVSARSILSRERLNGFGCTSDGGELWQPSLGRTSGDVTLLHYVQGRAAAPYLAAAPSIGHSASLEVLFRAFPGSREAIVEASTFSWVDEQWSRGAQALISSREIRTALAQPVGGLHFAGEYTTGGWANDALASAERVVEEITTERRIRQARAEATAN